MILFFSVLSILYYALLLWLYFHWSKIPADEPPTHATAARLPCLTVVIPVRNESATILLLLQDLAEQSDPVDHLLSYEVIVVDDASTDNTAQVVSNFLHTASYPIRLLSLEVPPDFEGSHKKLALQQAIDAARGEVIVTTDGDCRAGKYWLATISRFFVRYQPVLLSGPVTFHHEESLFELLQTIEFASLIGTGAACLQARRPNMGNGANLTFSRAAFYEVGGYEGNLHVPSGDDEFLLQKMARHYPDRLAFLKQSEATVSTCAQKSLSAFYQQRKRWAGKWKLHHTYYTAALAIFVFTYHLSAMIVSILTLLRQYPWPILLIQLFPKVVLEYLFLKSVLALMKKPLPLGYFFLMQLIYAPYAVFFGMRANFGGYTWKNRTYHG